MPYQMPPGDSVNRRFRRVVVVIYLVVLILVLWICAEQWRGYRDAAEAQREFVVVQAALQTMADISSERRPSFNVFIHGDASTQDEYAAQAAARRATDAHLAELDQTLQDSGCRACAGLLEQADKVRPALDASRQTLDAISRQPASPQRNEAATSAFEQMAGTIPLLSALAEQGATGVIRENADVQSYLLATRLTALLREQAGYLASQFVPALTLQRSLSQDEAFDMARTLGQIEQLRTLLGTSVRSLPPTLQRDFGEIERRYFGTALRYMNQLRSQALQPGGAMTSPAEMTRQYSPNVEPINRFRDDALALTGQTIRNSLHWHLQVLIGAALFASLLTGVLMVTIWRVREKIVRPFVEARQLILAIAAGKRAVAIPRDVYSGEIKELFGALAVLKHNSDERIRLEHERKRLIEELRTMAETDPLTGLLNRRAFEGRARVLAKNRRRSEPYLSLIMLDIDHFKHINDTYGHETGDRALVKLASLCREISRTEDVVARTGGEEFVMLLRVNDPAEAIALAQRLRARLHQEHITAVSDAVFGIRASFGIASALRTDSHQVDELMRQADALLYRAKQNGRDRVESVVLG
ncbi:diguanylate cyclase [Dyella sp. C9]|uniref:GGDEF domain-containing protein n=1 Tax=Dyella sp. C9 TaxID=2202154 RepID=UPI000DEECBE9|nr:GGDEF domain-containing protein [Dyella sp. C9]